MTSAKLDSFSVWRSSILEMQEKPSLSAGPSHPHPAQGLRDDQCNKLSDESHWRSASIIVSLIRANSLQAGFLEIVSFSLTCFLFASTLQQPLINCGLKLFRLFLGNKSSLTEQGTFQRKPSAEGEELFPGRAVSQSEGTCPGLKQCQGLGLTSILHEFWSTACLFLHCSKG